MMQKGGEDLVDGTAIQLKRPAGAPTSQRLVTKSNYGNESPRLLRSEPPLYAIHTKRQQQLVQSPSRGGIGSLSVQTNNLHSGDTQLHNNLLTESAVSPRQLENARLSLAGLQGGDLQSLSPSRDRNTNNPAFGVSSTCRRAKDIGSPLSQANFKSTANNISLLNEAGWSGDARGVLSGASIATRQQQHPSSGPPTKSLVLRKQPLLVLGNNNNSSPQSAVVRATSHTLAGTRTVRRSPTHLASLSPRNRQASQPAGVPTKPPLLQQPNVRGTGRSVFETTLSGHGNVIGSIPKDDHTSHGMTSSGQLANEADLIDVTATLDPDTAERLLGSTQIITGLRQYMGRQLSEDFYGDGTSGRAFALGGGISQSKRVTGSNSNGSNTMGGGAGRPSISPRLPSSRNNNDKHFFSLPDSIMEDMSQQQLLGDASPLAVKPNRRTNNFTSQSAQPPLSTFTVSGSTSATPGYDFRVVVSSGKTSGTPIQLSVGSGCVQGMRQTMEDEHFAALNHTHVRDQPVSLLGVLDGHCGRRVAALGAKHLPEFFFSHGALGDNNALAMVESILLTDRAIFHALHRSQVSGPGGHGKKSSHLHDLDLMNSPESGGSTLIAAAVHGRMLYVACLGDARAVLYDGNTTIAMSEDHKPSSTKENRRISRCGGFVQFGRVCGVLAVSRALGDFEFKFTNCNSNNSLLGTGGAAASPQSAKFSASKELMVSNVADVRQINLTDESKFLILACDGLWDVLSNEEATQFVKDFLTYTPDINDPGAAEGRKSKPAVSVVNRALNNCAQKLAEFAVDRGSSDNVSVMILFFHDVVDVVTGLNPAPRHQKVRKGGQGGRVSNASHVANPPQRGMPNVEDILHPKVKRR